MIPEDPDIGKMMNWQRDENDYTAQEYIIERIAEGDTLRQICKQKQWPYSAVARKIASEPEFNTSYEAALAIHADDIAQDTLEISDETKEATDGTQVSSAKLRVDTRLKLASRWNRQRYGEIPSVNINAQAGSLISILSSLPPLTAPEEHEEEIDITPRLETVHKTIEVLVEDNKKKE